jgi:hypothetical protein
MDTSDFLDAVANIVYGISEGVGSLPRCDDQDYIEASCLQAVSYCGGKGLCQFESKDNTYQTAVSVTVRSQMLPSSTEDERVRPSGIMLSVMHCLASGADPFVEIFTLPSNNLCRPLRGLNSRFNIRPRNALEGS